MLTRRILMTGLGATALSAATLGTTSPLMASEPWYFSADGAVMRGHDAVAYFTEAATVKGSRQYAVMWKGGIWCFASAANRSRFEMNPTAYAPQYGGYCAYAVSRGYTASTDPAAWRIVGGKLYLNHSMQVRALWLRDVPGNIAKADANWPDVLGG